MQIIPEGNSNNQAQTKIQIQEYPLLRGRFDSPSSLIAKNAHLVRQEQNVSPQTPLSFEDILRLKNSLTNSQKKLQQHEEDALRHLLEQGGSYTLQHLIEAMASGVRGIQGLHPEEYISLQQFLQDIGFDNESIDTLLEQMTTVQGSKEALQTIVNQGKDVLAKNPQEEYTNILPILRKIALGVHGDKGQESLTGDALIASIEELIHAIDTDFIAQEGVKQGLSQTLAEEIQRLVQNNEYKQKAQEQSSTQSNSQTTAETTRILRSATKEVYTDLASYDSSSSEYTADENLSQEQHAHQNLNEHQTLPLFSNTVKVVAPTTPFTHSQARFLQSPERNYIIQTVEQGFLSLQNNNSAQITLQLNPQQLGSIQLYLEYHDGRMQAMLRPEQQDVYHLLKEQAPHIMQSLQEQGLHVDAITVVENKGEWLQYQSSRDDFSQSTEEHYKEHNANEEQDRKERIRNLITQLSKENKIYKAARSNRLLEVIA